MYTVYLYRLAQGSSHFCSRVSAFPLATTSSSALALRPTYTSSCRPPLSSPLAPGIALGHDVDAGISMLWQSRMS